MPHFVLDCLIFVLSRPAAPEKAFADRTFRAARLLAQFVLHRSCSYLNDLKPAGMRRERAEIVLSV
jgi:hypothetical protein